MLYYKQVVEGYEDASRFAIMQRVGMTKRDIRESVNAQMLLIFLLPLAAAALHLAFAQPMVWQIMQLFGIQNLTLFLGVTGAALLLFALLYCAMYRLTSNAYFRIVSTGGAAVYYIENGTEMNISVPFFFFSFYTSRPYFSTSGARASSVRFPSYKALP